MLGLFMYLNPIMTLISHSTFSIAIHLFHHQASQRQVLSLYYLLLAMSSLSTSQYKDINQIIASTLS